VTGSDRKNGLGEGYYNHPKNTSIKDLAKLFNISPSTLTDILQRGEKKIISKNIKDT